MIRFAFTTILTLWCSSAAAAAAEAERSVLFEDTAFQSGYTAIGAKAGKAFGTYRSFVSAQAGWAVDSALTLGLKGDALPGAEDGSLSYLGLFVEVLPWRLGVATVKLAATVGSAEVGRRTNDDYTHDNFGFGELEIVGLLHLSWRVDLAMTVGGRMTGTPRVAGIEAADLRGATASLGFRGSF